MTFLFPEIISADIFLLELFMIQSICFLKKISVELFKAEITVFFQIMKETFFQYANCILNTTLIFGFTYFRRKNNRMIVFSPFGVILIKIRIDPVFIGDYSLFAIIAYSNGRNTLKVV